MLMPWEKRSRVKLDLHVELGPKMQVLLVRNSCPCCECSLVLSGNLSPLVCLKVYDVEPVLISRARGNGNMSNLYRLEMNNLLKQDAKIKGCSGFFHRNEIANAISWLMNCLTGPLFLWGQWILASYKYNQLAINPKEMVWMTSLGVLQLYGIRVLRLEDIGRHCPQLEVLEIYDKRLMSVSIIHAPKKLKRLRIAHLFPSYGMVRYTGDSLSRYRSWKLFPNVSYEDKCRNLRPVKSSKLVLHLTECVELEHADLDGCLFEGVEVMGSLPSRLRHLAMAAAGSQIWFNPKDVISSSMGQLSQLQTLELSCPKVERLDFRQQHFAYLERLRLRHCVDLTHVSVGAGCLRNLKDFRVERCHKLQVLEGLENVLASQYLTLDLSGLRGHSLWVICEHLPFYPANYANWYDFESGMCKCCGVKANRNYNVLEAFRSLRYTSSEARSEGLDTIVAQDPVRLLFMEWQLTCTNLTWLLLDHLEDLQEIGGLQHLQNLRFLCVDSLSNLTRVSGIWSTTIEHIMFQFCPMLQEISPLENTPRLKRLSFLLCDRLKTVEGRFREMDDLEYVQFRECQSMESFPVEDMMDEMKKMRGRISLDVHRCKFATLEVMERWLEDTEIGSSLFHAAIGGLMDEGAFGALYDRFSTAFQTLVASTSDSSRCQNLEENYLIELEDYLFGLDLFHESCLAKVDQSLVDQVISLHEWFHYKRVQTINKRYNTEIDVPFSPPPFNIAFELLLLMVRDGIEF